MSRLASHSSALASVAATFSLLLALSNSVVAAQLIGQPEAGSTAAPAREPPTPAADDTKLRICASAKQLPYSAQDNSGFENKIAAVVAKAMGREPVFVYADKPAIYLVRDWLNKNKCDVVIGLDTGDQRVLTTKPYYRTSYVFITKKDKNLDIRSWNDPKIKSLGHIVVDLGSPSEAMLKQINLYADNMAYLYSLVGFRSPRNEYVQIPPERMVAEVHNGGADMAAAFAADVARYVKSDPTLKMVAIKDDATRSDGEKLPQQYDQSMGVRLGDTRLLTQLDVSLAKAALQIDAILRDEGIPVVQALK
ncbi:methanol oxidation system protein MoxJ [Bradyrhizobium sp. SK17]|jgi:mxaJ protein|uniref:methanol oxidation system protein MoxJ n=1 Tax=Bradyrhizobium sp. SK17 TaxID=2057741 RepID=UPI000C309259|nr:methanol oxidation system protein MoxJ [Bradyrhizobium sp. SK17]AUC95606.1 methanol oxidation system protein MoxJ [Bradyrhizobium sp. SK17]